MWCHIIALPLFFCPNRKIEMRLLEITIAVYPKETTEILGENNRSLDVECRCIIDLDRVESFWEDPAKDGGDGILIKFYSGDSYWTKSFTLDQFKKKLFEETIQRVPYSDVVACTGNIEPCVVCGSSNVSQCGHELECVACGFKWVTPNAPRGPFNA